MKSYKKIMPLFLVALLAITVLYHFQDKAKMTAEYDTALETARNCAEKGIVTDALAQYATALEIRPSLELCLEAGQVYLDNNDLAGAKKWYTSQLLADYPKDAETYAYGLSLYLAQDNYRKAFGVYEDYQTRGLNSEAVETLMDTIRYKYDLKGSFTEVTPFSNLSGTAAVQYNGAWGYVDATGEKEISYQFLRAGVFSEYAAVTMADGSAAYIDQEGNQKINEAFILEKDPEFGTVREFRDIQSKLILASNGKVWNYYSLSTFEKVMGGFADAYPVVNGVGAVKNTAGKWALISANGTLITEYTYDDVVADEKNVISRTNAILVKSAEGYILVDRQGTRIGTGVYQDARGFQDTSYAAVKKNGTWLYVDPQGTELEVGKYEDARSFSNGLAAVQSGGLWGYIDMTGELVIPCTFLDAGPLHSAGVAFVKPTNDQWRLLSLYSYNHD